jgi:two-component system sensor histidine kinase UhpB
MRAKAAQDATKRRLSRPVRRAAILHNLRSMPVRLLTLLLRLSCLLALWALPCQAQPMPVQRFVDATVADEQGGGDHFPQEVAQRVVTLPDEWSHWRGPTRAPLWYRLRFDAPAARGQGALLGLLIERACANVEVWLNAQRVYGAGRMVDPIDADCERPRLVALPAALLEERNNTLDLRLAGYPLELVASRQRAAGLSAPVIGPWDRLQARHAAMLTQRITYPQAASAMLALMGVVVFVMGWWYRRESHLACFGMLSIGWSAITARLWWVGSGLPNYERELLLVSGVPWVAMCAVLFLMHYARRRSRPIEVALLAQCAMVPASLLLAGPARLNMIASSWYLLLALQVGAAMAFYLSLTWRLRRRDFWPMLAILALMATMVGIELAAQQRMIDSTWRLAPTLGMPLGFLLLGLWLVREYGRALQSADEMRATLETRIRETTTAMEKSFGQMAELRVEQVTQQERKRIAADLHDDLGAKLLTIVHTSESERISTLAREALEEMRLSVRGLTGKPVKLIDALGDWRAEVVGRLSQTGVEGEWSSPTEDVPQTLSARAYVQTTRILREAVNNIIKHSGASRCSIRCTIAEGDFQLKIQDNGKGIPLELDGRLDRGHGMSSMKHRAKQLHGQCLVESGPGYGTVIRLTIPLEKHTLTA